MKDIYKGILGIAIFYVIAVTVLDYFLARIPIVNWLALSMVFVFFTILILDSVIKELPARRQASEREPETGQDELERLEEIVQKALVQRQVHSQEVLCEKLKAMLVTCCARKVNRSVAQLRMLAESDPESFRAIVEDDGVSKFIIDDLTITRGIDMHEVERILSKIEVWLG